MIADYLAEHWADNQIAILRRWDDLGKGVAEAVKEHLQGHGVTLKPSIRPIVPGEEEYGAEIDSFRRPIAVVLHWWLPRETGLMLRQRTIVATPFNW